MCLLWRKGACQAIWALIMGGDSKFCVNKTKWQETPRSLLWQLSNMTISSWVMRQNEPICLTTFLEMCVNRKGNVIYCTAYVKWILLCLLWTNLWFMVARHCSFWSKNIVQKIGLEGRSVIACWTLEIAGKCMTREDGPITTEFQQQDIEKWQKYKEAFIVLTMFIFTARFSIGIILVHWQRGYF